MSSKSRNEDLYALVKKGEFSSSKGTPADIQEYEKNILEHTHKPNINKDGKYLKALEAKEIKGLEKVIKRMELGRK